MLIEDGDIRFGAVEYDRSAMLARAMDYVKKGTMLETDLQDAMFFFGDAPTSREPLRDERKRAIEECDKGELRCRC